MPEEELESSLRPFWSGTISFGLVSIPVNLYPGNRESRVSLRMLSSDGQPLKREYVGGETGRELDDRTHDDQPAVGDQPMPPRRVRLTMAEECDGVKAVG